MKMIAVAMLLASGLSGCATIFQGTHSDLEIHTRPDKAQIWVDGVQQGTAPATISMEVQKSHVVVIRAPGYKEQTIRTDNVLSGGFVALDIILGLVPVIVDAATGAWYKVQPSPMNVMLTPEGGAPEAAAAPPPAPTAPAQGTP